MTDAVSQRVTIPLQLVGDPTAAACVGEFCEIPDHHEQSIVNRRLDEDATEQIHPTDLGEWTQVLLAGAAEFTSFTVKRSGDTTVATIWTF